MFGIWGVALFRPFVEVSGFQRPTRPKSLAWWLRALGLEMLQRWLLWERSGWKVTCSLKVKVYVVSSPEHVDWGCSIVRMLLYDDIYIYVMYVCVCKGTRRHCWQINRLPKTYTLLKTGNIRIGPHQVWGLLSLILLPFSSSFSLVNVNTAIFHVNPTIVTILLHTISTVLLFRQKWPRLQG